MFVIFYLVSRFMRPEGRVTRPGGKAAAGALRCSLEIYGMILHIMDQAGDVGYGVATASSNALNKVLSICVGDHPSISSRHPEATSS